MIDPPIHQEILKKLSRLDRFQGAWASQLPLPEERLARLAEAATIQSVTASCRLAGLRTSEAEVAEVLAGPLPPQREGIELRGYAQALARSLLEISTPLDADALRGWNATILGLDAGASWRTDSLHREEFDAEGRATGRVFATLPARLIEPKTDELLAWLEHELRSGEKHPVLVVAVFVVFLHSISPFERGNGRLARVLTNRLLMRAGYAFLPYVSLEAVTEQLRDEYYNAMDRAQNRIWTEQADILPWIEFFVGALDLHRHRIEARVRLERDILDFPPLQQVILRTVREHGSVDAGLLIRATGANRHTLKDNLRRLVQSGLLRKTGQRRGTRYQIGVGEPVSR